MNYLITGGCGFVGSNIAHRLMRQGETVTVLDNLSRFGAAQNLDWLRASGPIDFVHGDTRSSHEVDDLIARLKPGAIFHLAAQTAATTSLADPRHDFEVNVMGSINVLEAVRRLSPQSAVIYSSSNKVYGDLGGLRLVEEETRYTAPDLPNGADESARLDFHTPYGCSKGATDQYMLDYARYYGLNTIVFRHSTMYGGRQFATYDQGWVGWFCQKAAEQKADPSTEAFTICGDGKQVRDLLYADDAVSCYLAGLAHMETARGQVFNIGGGVENSCSLLELFDELERITGIKLRYRRIDWREGDQKIFVADSSKAIRTLGWKPTVPKRDGIERIYQWVETLQTQTKAAASKAA